MLQVLLVPLLHLVRRLPPALLLNGPLPGVPPKKLLVRLPMLTTMPARPALQPVKLLLIRQLSLKWPVKHRPLLMLLLVPLVRPTVNLRLNLTIR